MTTSVIYQEEIVMKSLHHRFKRHVVVWTGKALLAIGVIFLATKITDLQDYKMATVESTLILLYVCKLVRDKYKQYDIEGWCAIATRKQAIKL
jgi:hypothetical protein